MTNEEIFKKIKQYESKWGKLGHTNIMNPEKNAIHHSGTNKDISQGGNKTMSRMDNELYKFRQKVAAGKEANRLAHKSYISPDELNKMNYDQLMNSHTLIHAQNPLYGQQNPNAKYYKREGEPGKYRYYYTKEEYDAAHSNGNAADANREAQARSTYETNKKIENYKNKQNVTNTSSNARENNSQADFTKKFSDIARQSPEAAAKEIINDDNTKIKTFYNKIDDGFRKGIIVWKNGRFEMGEDASDSDYENIKDEIESYSDQLEKFVKDVDTAAGSGKKTKDAIAKMMTNEIESMYQKAEKGKENLKANQNSREAAIKKAQENDKTSKEYKEAIGEKEPLKSEDNESWKERQDKILDDAMKDDANLKDLASKYNVSEEYIQELVYNVTGKTLKKEEKKSSNSSNNSAKTSKEYDAEKEYNSKKNSYGSAKHSALITNSNMGDEIMDEYSAFQEKVKRGREMNRIAHSTFISPSDLNARYEKDLEKEGILVHAGNYKYYNKIDMPNGTTRYFYTKAEWDAYQKEKDSKNNTNQKLSEETLKQIEQQKQKKEAYDKNKAAEEAQKKAESDKWDTHKKIREDFHQVPGYMTYSSTFVDDMKATPEGSDKGKDFLFNAMKDAYKKYPKMENIRNSSSKDSQKPKDEEVFGFMNEIQKGIDKYTKDFINKYQLPEQEYTPIINNYFLSMADDLMKENDLDYNYIKDVYYRNSDVGKKEAKKEEILKQGDFNNRIFREDYKNKWNIYNEIFDKDYDRDSEVYKVNLQNFADNGPESKYLKETIESLKKRRTNDGKPQYSDEDIYNAAYTFLWKNFQKQAVDSDYAFSPDLFKLIPDIMNAMGYKGSYTADPQDLVYKK